MMKNYIIKLKCSLMVKKKKKEDVAVNVASDYFVYTF